MCTVFCFFFFHFIHLHIKQLTDETNRSLHCIGHLKEPLLFVSLNSILLNVLVEPYVNSCVPRDVLLANKKHDGYVLSILDTRFLCTFRHSRTTNHDAPINCVVYSLQVIHFFIHRLFDLHLSMIIFCRFVPIKL